MVKSTNSDPRHCNKRAKLYHRCSRHFADSVVSKRNACRAARHYLKTIPPGPFGGFPRYRIFAKIEPKSASRRQIATCKRRGQLSRDARDAPRGQPGALSHRPIGLKIDWEVETL